MPLKTGAFKILENKLKIAIRLLAVPLPHWPEKFRPITSRPRMEARLLRELNALEIVRMGLFMGADKGLIAITAGTATDRGCWACALQLHEILFFVWVSFRRTLLAFGHRALVARLNSFPWLV
jgi:hypothetical protein